MKKTAKIATLALLGPAMFVVVLQNVLATPPVTTVHNAMGVVENCTTIVSTCFFNPETHSYTGAIYITTGTLQRCVPYPNSDCPLYNCHGTTTATYCN